MLGSKQAKLRAHHEIKDDSERFKTSKTKRVYYVGVKQLDNKFKTSKTKSPQIPPHPTRKFKTSKTKRALDL